MDTKVKNTIEKLENLYRMLDSEQEKHKNDKLMTFETNISLMCSDIKNEISNVIALITELKQLIDKEEE